VENGGTVCKIHIPKSEITRVLLVEDNPGDARLIREMLKEASARFELTRVERLDEGLKRLGEETFDVMLLDLNLADSQGLDTFVQAHAQAPGVPIVVLTGLADEVLGVKAVQGGAQDYLVKGQVEGNPLARALHYAIERKRAEEALKEYSERLQEMVEERTKELREAQEELVRQEKLAILGQLAGGVAHELRTPLGSIKNAAYFLNMVLEDPDPETKEMLEILEREVATSERVISSLLDFARAELPIRREVDVNEVVREALSRAAVPENVEVVRQFDESLPTILADPDQLVEVFENIILNAIQAMTLPTPVGISEGGRLVVKTSEVFQKPPRSGWVAISITDTGCGIPEENLGKVFEPLFTTKAKGIGLGLAIVKMLVEGHGGSIEVQSPLTGLGTGEVGKGSTFTVILPIGEEERKESEKDG
jgi:signal transduction histidine kinase